MKYVWVDRLTGLEVEVSRPMSKVDEQPSFDECLGMYNKDEYDSAKWERVISGGQTMTRGKNWKGRKGHF